jgi:hypothetical protein
MALVPTLAGYAEGTAGNISTAFSSAPSAGDLLVACLSATGASPTVTPPSGWTQIGSTLTQGSTIVAIYYRFAAGGTTAYTFTLGGTISYSALTWFRIQGAASAGIDQSSLAISAFGSSNPWTKAPGSVTPINPNEIVIAISAVHGMAGSAISNTALASYTAVGSPSYGTGLDHQAAYYLDQTTAAAANPGITWTYTGNEAGVGCGIVISIAPSAQTYTPATAVTNTILKSGRAAAPSRSAVTSTIASVSKRAVARFISAVQSPGTASLISDYNPGIIIPTGTGTVPLPGREFGYIIMYDQYNRMSNVITGIDMMHCTDVVNGGSGDGEFRVLRRFVDTQFLGSLLGLAGQPRSCRLQYYLPDSNDPWYDGRITSIDQIQNSDKDDEVISIVTEGWQNRLGDAIVSESVNPGVQPNGQNNGSINAQVYLLHLFGTYKDPVMFANMFFASSDGGLDNLGPANQGILLDPLQFDGEKLNQCIDDVIKQITDSTGLVIEWAVRGVAPWRSGNGLNQLNVVVQSDQNPNLNSYGYDPNGKPFTIIPQQVAVQGSGSTKYGLLFQYVFLESSTYDYQIQTTTQNLYNMIALYGGRDPISQQQIYQAFERSDSIALYGIRQQKVTNTSLISSTTLTNYATSYLATNAFPQPQATFKVVTPRDGIKAGKWLQVMIPGFGSLPGTTTHNQITGNITGGQSQQTVPYSNVSGVIPYQGMVITIGAGSSQEYVTLLPGTNSSHIVGIFAENHTSGAAFTDIAQMGQPGTTAAAQVVNQVRAISVEIQLQEGEEQLEMLVTATAPRPFIDHAYYGALRGAANNNSASALDRGGTVSGKQYIYDGGNWTSSQEPGASPWIWTVNIAGVKGHIGYGPLDQYSQQPTSGYQDTGMVSAVPSLQIKTPPNYSNPGVAISGLYEVLLTTIPYTLCGTGVDGTATIVCYYVGPGLQSRTPYDPRTIRLWGFTLINGGQSGSKMSCVDLRPIAPLTSQT